MSICGWPSGDRDYEAHQRTDAALAAFGVGLPAWPSQPAFISGDFNVDLRLFSMAWRLMLDGMASALTLLPIAVFG
eukprot:4200251-Alexandrium_andersonii.AAC.1